MIDFISQHPWILAVMSIVGITGLILQERYYSNRFKEHLKYLDEAEELMIKSEYGDIENGLKAWTLLEKAREIQNSQRLTELRAYYRGRFGREDSIHSNITNKQYSDKEVNELIKLCLSEAMLGFLDWLKNETDVINSTTKEILPNTEIELKDNAKGIIDGYIRPRLKDKGIDLKNVIIK